MPSPRPSAPPRPPTADTGRTTPPWRSPAALAVGASLLCAPPTMAAPDQRAGLAVEGRTPAATLHAEGVQIYECRAGASGSTWQFREPLATLMREGRTVGRHFAGPSWELADGSAVTGKVAAQAPGDTARDITWLRLDVTDRRGAGGLSEATAVQRVNTRGGVLAGPCADAGALHLEPYAADYVFFGR